MKRFSLLLSLLFAAGQLAAQANPEDTEENEEQSTSGGWTYVGDDRRVGIGIDEEGDLLGDILWLFSEDNDSAWLGEGWIGKGGAGGVKLDYHWVPGGLDPNQPANVPDNISVQKLFLAVDQNMHRDRKATVGWGIEKERWFMNVQGSAGLTDERLASRVSDVSMFTETGLIDGRPYMQDFTTTTVTELWEQAYDYGVGARAGHWFDQGLMRFTGGLDYEWGDYSSDQVTLSLELEKYFAGSPHSFSIGAEVFSRDGDFETRDEDDLRGFVMYRYDFGSNRRAVQVTERVRVESAVSTGRKRERVLVEHEVSVNNDVFFELDRYEVREGAEETLREVSRILREHQVVGVVELVGNTCDLGTEPYNQRLSERRANAVSEVLVNLGVDGAIIRERGDGETNPQYPNDSEENRSKNRRVDIRFVTVQEGWEEVEVDAPEEVQWETRVVPREPAWLRRALRNPASHKRRVDTYQFQTVNSETVAGDIVFTNALPGAVDDSITIDQDSGAVVIDVLANDSDPDGDALVIVAVSEAVNGSVDNNGNHVTYTPNSGFFGTDSFSYTVDDGNGGTASAVVTVTVNQVEEEPNRAPVANDDFLNANKNTTVVLDVLGNDFDPDGDVLTIINVVHTSMGTAEINPEGTITYTPMADWYGSDTVVYTIEDEHGATDTATAYLYVRSW